MYSVFINGVEAPELGKFKNVGEFEKVLITKAVVVKRLKVKDGIYGYFVTGLNGETKIQTVMLVSRKGEVIAQMA